MIINTLSKAMRRLPSGPATRLIANAITAYKATYVAVSDLPPLVAKVLRENGYRRPDIGVLQSTSWYFTGPAGDGSRSFTVVVNLATEQVQRTDGGWGGGMTPNLNDHDRQERPLPPNIVIISGTEKNGPTFAQLHVNPRTVAALLPPPNEDVSPDELKALKIIRMYVSSYRKAEFEREGLGAYSKDNPHVQSLSKLGLVKVAGNGVAMTTKGKNAAK